jgi:hypothetical protein
VKSKILENLPFHLNMETKLRRLSTVTKDGDLLKKQSKIQNYDIKSE